MDLRVLGNLFRNTKEEVQRMERLILITPRIITYDMLDSPVPQRVHEQNFAIDPTSSGYALPPPRRGSGCFSGAGNIFPAPAPAGARPAGGTSNAGAADER
jgi:hypothetical protein